MGTARLEQGRFYRAALDVPFFATEALISNKLQEAGFAEVSVYASFPAGWSAALKKGDRWARGRWNKATGDYPVPGEVLAFEVEGASSATPPPKAPPPMKPPASSPPTSPPSNWRGAFLAAARARLGTPYQWGGGHGDGMSWGLDCSGLVLQAAKAAGLVLPPGATTADTMWRTFRRVQTPEPGDLAFYGSGGKAQHVVIVTSWDGTKAATIGANGGDQTTTTPAAAAAKNARVDERPDHRAIRKDFLGFGSISISSSPSTPATDDGKALLVALAIARFIL